MIMHVQLLLLNLVFVVVKSIAFEFDGSYSGEILPGMQVCVLPRLTSKIFSLRIEWKCRTSILFRFTMHSNDLDYQSAVVYNVNILDVFKYHSISVA